MSYEPFDTTLVEERIKASVPALRLVAGAADYAAVKDLRGFVVPSAFVLLADEEPGGAPRGAPVAPAHARVGVAIAARNYQPGAGGQLSDELRSLVGAVRKALIGWTPPVTGATAVAWAGGAVMDYDASAVLYIDTFVLTHVLTR